MLITFYSSACFLFLLFHYYPDDLNYTLLMLISIPASVQLGFVIYEHLQESIFSSCLGKPNLNLLPPNELDIFVRLLNKNLNFFYEDYIDRG
jgi:hypothetical protein